MQKILYLLIVGLFSVDWLVEVYRVLPSEAGYFVEVIALIAALVIIVNLARKRKMDVDGRTAAVLAFFLASVIGSAIINSISPTVLISGLRLHLKFFPFLLLPLVYHFTPRDIRLQFRLILIFTLIQVPIAFIQRFIIFGDVRSGDGVGGTLGGNASGILSVWLACMLSIILAGYLSGAIKRKWAFIALPLIAAPTMINETKISFFMVPVALILPVLMLPKNRARLGQMTLAASLVTLFFVFMIPVYDSFRSSGSSITEWFSSEEARNYVYRGEQTGGARGDVRRLDSVALAVHNLRYENALLFGLGPGNVSPSFAREYEGEYLRRYFHYSPNRVHASTSIWEIGLVGSLMYLLLMASTGIAALKLRQHEDPTYRALSLGWIGVTAIVFLSLVYFRLYSINLFNTLYWLYSGVLVAEYARQRISNRSKRKEEHRILPQSGSYQGSAVAAKFHAAPDGP